MVAQPSSHSITVVSATEAQQPGCPSTSPRFLMSPPHSVRSGGRESSSRCNRPKAVGGALGSSGPDVTGADVGGVVGVDPLPPLVSCPTAQPASRHSPATLTVNNRWAGCIVPYMSHLLRNLTP